MLHRTRSLVQRLASLFACCIFLLFAPVAFAAPTPAQRAEAATKEGAAFEKAGKLEEALAKYEDAYKDARSGMASFRIAHAAEALGRFPRALASYREALRDAQLPAATRREAEVAIEQLRTKIGLLVLDVPAGAETTVDGTEVDPKLPVEVAPGTHTIKSRLGTETSTADATVAAGATVPVTIRFGRAPTPTTPPPPHVTPPPVTEPPPTVEGVHWPTAKKVVVGAGAAVAAGLLVGTLVVALGAERPEAPSSTACANPAAPGCADFADKRDVYDNARTVSTVLFYSGLVVAAGTVAAALLWPNERTTSARLDLTRLRLEF